MGIEKCGELFYRFKMLSNVLVFRFVELVVDSVNRFQKTLIYCQYWNSNQPVSLCRHRYFSKVFLHTSLFPGAAQVSSIRHVLPFVEHDFSSIRFSLPPRYECHYCILRVFPPCWSSLWFISIVAMQDYWLPPSFGSLHRTFWYYKTCL